MNRMPVMVPIRETSRRILTTIVGCIVSAGLTLACSDSGEPSGGEPLPPTPFVVSNPVPGVAPAPATRSASSVSSVIYVSLPPGAIPGASAANIHDRQTSSSVSVRVVNGGFDPVAVGAAAGDTIEVVVGGAGITHPVSYLIIVAEKARPGVVRTNPPSHKRDVPLNTIIEVVFSEPMDSVSLLGNVILSLAGSQVSGKVVIPANAGDILEATFVPDAPLAPLSTYQLQVGAAAQDRDGDRLAVPVQSDFTTSGLPADLAPPVVQIVTPSEDSQAFEYPSFRAVVTDNHDIAAMSWTLLENSTGGSPIVNDMVLGDAPTSWDEIVNLWQPLDPGTYTIQLTVWDAAGNGGSSAPMTLTFAAPDTQPRIVVRSFSVTEYEVHPAGSGQWAYAPQLVVADAPGQSGLEIVGFQMLTIPGLASNSLWWKIWSRLVAVTPGQDTPLFREIYGDYDFSFGANGQRSSGGQVSARLTYRDATTGHLYATTMQGSIVPGPSLPGTYTGSCSYWMGAGAYTDCFTASQRRLIR